MAGTFAGGTLRVTTPSSYDAQAGLADPDAGPAGWPRRRSSGRQGRARRGAGGRRSRPGRAGRPDASQDQGPRREAGRQQGGKVQLEVDVPPGEDAVVLLEHDGVYSWHLPVNPAERTRSLDKKPRTARFEIAVQPGHRGQPTQDTEDRRTRGLLGDLVQGAAQALVFRFVAPAILEKAIDKMEDHVRPGLVHLADVDVKKWRELENLDELDLPNDQPVRLLLLVHGTFSSTVGGVRRAGHRRERQGVPAHGDLGVRRSHRVRPQDPQPRPEAERRGPADAPQDAHSERRARHRRRHAQPRRSGDPILRRAAASRGGLAGHGRQRRLRRVHQRGHSSCRPEAVERPRRPLHQPGCGRRERALDAAGWRTRRRCCGWRGEGDRGVREVPRLVRRRG